MYDPMKCPETGGKVLGRGNPNARHHGKGLERATFCHGVELSYC